ncbi:MAG: glycosyl transferase, partial [Cellulosilyticaceae bacterium]
DFLIEKYPKLQELLVLKLINTVMSLLNKICVQKDFEQYSEQYNELVRVLNRHFLTVIKLREYPKTVKILLIATKVNPQLYKVLINQIVRRK